MTPNPRIEPYGDLFLLKNPEPSDPGLAHLSMTGRRFHYQCENTNYFGDWQKKAPNQRDGAKGIIVYQDV